MFVTLRSTLLVIAALTGSSVAPAKVAPPAAPMIETGYNDLSAVPASLPLTPEESSNLLTPPDESFASEPADAAPEKPEPVRSNATLAETVAQYRSSEPASHELECLAVGVYFEAKSESLQGQLAVGHVIANRATSGRFPSSYCGVIFQRSQFSFVRGHSLPSVPRSSMQWKNAVAIATIVDQKIMPTPVGKALFFHARRVSPGWRLTRVATLGNHVFYR